jgi:DNA polymerase
VLFIGEAPGRNEDESGRPFVGQAGKLLEKNLNVIGLQRSDVFVTNIVKYRPPDNRDPFPEEIAACKDWLDEQIKIIDPKIIVTLGRFSMGKFIEGVTISKVHGQPRFVDFGGKRYIVYPMFHPAAALRSGSMMKPFEEDFVKLSTLLTKPVSVAEAKDNNGQLNLF